MKKLRLVAISLVLMFVAVLGVRAEVTYPEVTDATATNSSSADAEIVGTKSSVVTVTVNSGEWNLLNDGTGESVSRPAGYTWVGLNFKWDSAVTDVKIDTTNETLDVTHAFTEYFGFNLEEVKAAAAKGENLTKTFTLTWTEGSENGTLTINLVVEPAKITMVDKSTVPTSTTPVWNETIYNETVEEHTHEVVVETDSNGEVEVYPENALEGKEVVLTVKPNEGYELATLTVTYLDGEEEKTVEVTDDKFVMPANDVKVVATFKKIEVEKADTTELEKAIAEAEKYLDDKKYDAKEVEALRKIIEEAKSLIGADKEGQDTVDGMVDVLKDAMTKVANTGDNIVSVVVTGMVSLAVIAGGIVLIRKNKANN